MANELACAATLAVVAIKKKIRKGVVSGWKNGYQSVNNYHVKQR